MARNIVDLHFTDPKESPYWRDGYEEIVRSYPDDEQEQVRCDLMNGRNSEKYGIKRCTLHAFTLTDDFTRLMKNVDK